MDTDNKKDFSDRLTVVGHARGNKVPDHRMFKMWITLAIRIFWWTPLCCHWNSEKYYYEAVAMIIVPEETALPYFFDDDADFEKQLNIIYDTAEG